MSLGTRTLAQISQAGGSKHSCVPSETGNLTILSFHCVKQGTQLVRAHSCILQVRLTVVRV